MAIMANIVVRHFGQLREIVGTGSEKVIIDDSASLIQLIEFLSSKHGRRFENFVYDKNHTLRKSLAFAADGDSVQESKLRSMKCGNIEEFVILPPSSGGCD